jgi:glycosyltransferase involved in cell wall biosynthesis
VSVSVSVSASVLVDVVVPARDEADRIGDALTALVEAAAELRRLRPGDDARITVVLDDCRDDTEAVVRAVRRRGTRITVLEVAAHAVGVARAHGAARALRRPAHAPHRWIANTDADSRVPVGWLVQHADAARSGADLLVGAVVPDPSDLDAETYRRWRAAHRDDSALGHVHGANLGVSAAAYERLEGFGSVPEHEDVDLVARARSAGFAVVATLDEPVVTSGRLDGRTPGGYAEHLRRTYTGPIAAV